MNDDRPEIVIYLNNTYEPSEALEELDSKGIELSEQARKNYFPCYEVGLVCKINEDGTADCVGLKSGDRTIALTEQVRV